LKSPRRIIRDLINEVVSMTADEWAVAIIEKLRANGYEITRKK